MKQLLSPGELIDRSWDLYRNQFRSFMNVSGWLILIAILNVIAIILFPNASTAPLSATLTTRETAGIVLFGVSNFILSPLLGFWVFIAVIRTSLRAVANKPVDFKQVMKETQHLFFPTLIITILVSLMIVLAQIITIGPAAIIFGIGSWMHNTILIGLGDILMILAAFVSLILTCRWILFYFMAPYTCTIDGAEKRDALTQSRLLVQGRFWSTLIRIVLPKFVFILFGLGFASIVTFIIRILLNGSTGMTANQLIELNIFTRNILSILIAIFLNPLLILSDVILYKNLKGE